MAKEHGKGRATVGPRKETARKETVRGKEAAARRMLRGRAGGGGVARRRGSEGGRQRGLGEEERWRGRARWVSNILPEGVGDLVAGTFLCPPW